MKYIIVGLHSSGKSEILRMLEQSGVKVGRTFSNLDTESTSVYNSYEYEIYDLKDVRDMFENHAYIFLHNIESPNIYNSAVYYEGLSFYDYDNNDVFVMSPDQFLAIPKNVDLGDVCIVWLDNTRNNRTVRYNEESRKYDFNHRETIEKQYIDVFINSIYKYKNLMYFTDEDPHRVATIIKTCVNHPEVLPDFVANFRD